MHPILGAQTATDKALLVCLLQRQMHHQLWGSWSHLPMPIWLITPALREVLVPDSDESSCVCVSTFLE